MSSDMMNRTLGLRFAGRRGLWASESDRNGSGKRGGGELAEEGASCMRGHQESSFSSVIPQRGRKSTFNEQYCAERYTEGHDEPDDTSVDPGHSFHVLTKPIGPICNLDCKYCFYLEKEKLYPGERKWAMSEEVLETYVRQYIEGQDVPQVYFAWQGGEPTLLGVEVLSAGRRATAEICRRQKYFQCAADQWYTVR